MEKKAPDNVSLLQTECLERHGNTPERSIMLVREIMIDEEFESILRPQTQEESSAMRESIAANGFLSPLLIWSGTRILIDGHHRIREYKRIYDEWKAADASVGVMQRLKGGSPREPIPPDMKQMEFPNREAVMRFIFDTQASRRNLNEAEMSLARAKAYQAAAVKVGEKAARETVAAKFDVSQKTVRRDVQFQKSVDIVGPAVQASYPGADFMKYVTSPDRPAQAVVNDAADIIASNPEKVAEAVAMVVDPKSKLRLDTPEDGKPKPPAWETKLMAFEQILEKIWSDEDTDTDTKKAVRRRVKGLVIKFFPQMVAAPKQKAAHAGETVEAESETTKDVSTW
jgi:hypothetical protein